MRASILVPSTLKCPLLLIINGLGLGFEGVSAKISEAHGLRFTPNAHSTYPLVPSVFVSHDQRSETSVSLVSSIQHVQWGTKSSGKKMMPITQIDHIRILSIGLELACNGG